MRRRPKEQWATLTPRLEGYREEIGRIARTKPLVVVPPGVLRTASGLLEDVRAIAKPSEQAFALSRAEELTFSELNAVLGEACQVIVLYGTRNGLNARYTPRQERELRDITQRLARRLDWIHNRTRQLEEIGVIIPDLPRDMERSDPMTPELTTIMFKEPDDSTLPRLSHKQ